MESLLQWMLLDCYFNCLVDRRDIHLSFLLQRQMCIRDRCVCVCVGRCVCVCVCGEVCVCVCVRGLLHISASPRDRTRARMPSSA